MRGIIKRVVDWCRSGCDEPDRKLGHIFPKQGGWTAAAIVVSGVIGAASSKSASNSQERSANKARQQLNQMIGPYADAGRAGLPAVQQFVDEGADFSNTQAYKDIVNQSKAGGMSMSGNRLTALTDYYATNFRPQRLNELMTLPTLGANAAAGQATNNANLLMAQGNARAAGTLGMANAANNTLNNLAFLNAWQNQSSSVQSDVSGLLNQKGMF